MTIVRAVQVETRNEEQVQLLLADCRVPQQDLIKIKLLLWRTWTMHNNITHQSGPSSILESVQALLSVQSALTEIQKEKDWSELGFIVAEAREYTCYSRSGEWHR